MNNIKIGRERERAVGDFLVKDGVIDRYWQPPAPAKFRPEEKGGSDIFGCFDLFCYTWSGYPWLVQVTKWGHHKARLEAIEKFMADSGMGGYVSWMLVAYKLKKKDIVELRIAAPSGGAVEWEQRKVQIRARAYHKRGD